MKYFIVQNTWANYIPHGWGNGYVAVPPTSKLHGLNYDDVDVDVHGGLTYSNIASNFKYLPDDIPRDWWIFGFDTMHARDNQTKHNKKYVEKETRLLKKQLLLLESS